MNTTTTKTTTPARMLATTTEALSDFGSGVLLPLLVPTLVLGALVLLFVGPLVLLARSAGAI